MGIKTYNPYTPSRRNMTGSDFSEITKSNSGEVFTSFSEAKMLDVIIRVKSLLDTAAVELRRKYRIIDFKRR